MIIEREIMDIGSRVRLTEDVKLHNRIYIKGHEFTIYGISERGFDLIDDDGNKIDETRFIQSKYELITQAKKSK